MLEYKDLKSAINMALTAHSEARNDHLRERLYYHVDKLLDAEAAYFGAPQSSEEDEPDEAEEEADPDDEEKIAARVAEGSVTVVPPKGKRKAMWTDEQRHAAGERLRKRQAEKKGRSYTPQPFMPNEHAQIPLEDEQGEEEALAGIEFGNVDLRP